MKKQRKDVGQPGPTSTLIRWGEERPVRVPQQLDIRTWLPGLREQFRRLLS